MRTICVVLIASLATGCASTAAGGRGADSTGAASTSATWLSESRGLRNDDGRLDDADELVGFLVQAAVIGGLAVVIYLTRFRGRGGGGGDSVPVEPLSPEAAVSTQAERPVPDWALPRFSPDAAAMVDADAGAAFRPCGAICTGEPM